jgi:hypothetical protein
MGARIESPNPEAKFAGSQFHPEEISGWIFFPARRRLKAGWRAAGPKPDKAKPLKALKATPSRSVAALFSALCLGPPPALTGRRESAGALPTPLSDAGVDHERPSHLEGLFERQHGRA